MLTELFSQGLLLFIVAILKNARMRSRFHFQDPTIYHEEHRATGALEPQVMASNQSQPLDTPPIPSQNKKEGPLDAIHKEKEERASSVAAPPAPILTADATYTEERYAPPKEPEYMRVK